MNRREFLTGFASCAALAGTRARAETPTGVPGSCVFRLSELRCFGHYVFRVRPLECFGKRGAELDSERIVLKRPARTKASAKTSAKTPSKVQK